MIKKDIVIIGAGITGLSLAHFLKKAEQDFTLLEQENCAGGKVKTIRKNGYICECGPNTVQLQEKALHEIIEDLGLNNSVVFANKSNSKNRYVHLESGIKKLPSGPLALFSTDLINSTAKWKIFKDIFSKSSLSHEKITVEEYFNKKFGKSLTENIIDPFVTGIYAGDTKKMSFKYAFPKLFKADQEKGSLIRGLIGGRKSKTTNKGIFSFTQGLNELIQNIETEVSSNLSLNSEVQKIERTENGYYKILCQNKAGTTSIEAKKIIDTRPIKTVMNNLGIDDNNLNPEYVPVISLHLGFKLELLKNVPKGFGILNSREAKKKYLGCIFNTDIFPHTAPENHKLYTILIGGSRNPNVALNFDDQKLDEIIQDFCRTMKIDGKPDFTHHFYWPAAIPQYNLGHETLLQSIANFHSENKNYLLLGNYFGGVSIGDCVKKAKEMSVSITNQD